MIDCGCNYGFYSFYTASLSKKNEILAIEASAKTLDEFRKNLKLNSFKNINFFNYAISNSIGENILFKESTNDWESSQVHDNFEYFSESNVKTITIDSLIKDYSLDVEGNEINAIKGALKAIKKSDPLIIIEFSKFIFENLQNIEYLKNFLIEYDYCIFDTNYNKKNLNNILDMLKKLKKTQKTIGNFYLIKNSSSKLKLFLSNE